MDEEILFPLSPAIKSPYPALRRRKGSVLKHALRKRLQR
jgi:hypothetical protein